MQIVANFVVELERDSANTLCYYVILFCHYFIIMLYYW